MVAGITFQYSMAPQLWNPLRRPCLSLSPLTKAHIYFNHQMAKSSKTTSLSKLGNNNSIFTTRFVLQPSLQYPPTIPFSTSAMFHLPISPPHVFPKPSLQSLPKLPFSIPHQPFFNSLLVHTTIPTVSIKIFPHFSLSADSSCVTGQWARVLWEMTLV